MSRYYVEWRIDIDAETAEEAATKALLIQRDTDSTALVFNVCDSNGEWVQVDLWEDAP